MLERFDDDYEAAEVSENEFAPLADGTYQVFVDEICLKETKETKLPMIAWRFQIINGSRQGSKIFKNSVVTDDTLSFIKTDFSVCAFHPKKLSDIEKKPKVLEALLNLQLEVKLVTKGKYQNVYIQRRLEEGEVKGEEQDDIPF